MTTPNPQGYPGQDPNAPGQPGVPPQPGPPPGYGPPGAPPPGYPPPQGGYPPPQGGYPPPQQGGYPQPGGYPQQGGYPPAGYGAPPPGYANADDKTWALVAHFGGAAGSLVGLGPLAFVGPLISYLGRGSQSETVKAHAKGALNFFIPVSGAAILLWIAQVCIGNLFLTSLLWLLQLAVAIVGIAFGIIAGMRANEGQMYKYPLNIGLIK